MAKRLLSLKTRLSLTYGAVSLLLMLVLLVTHNMMGSHFQTYVVQKREQTAKNVVKTIEEQLLKMDLNHIHYTELGYALLNEGLVLSVWDATERQVYCIHCDDTKACQSKLYDVWCTTSMRDSTYQGTYMEMDYSLQMNGTELGFLRFGYSGPYYYTQADVDFIGRMDTIFIVTGVLCTMLAAGLGYLMARGIVKPIREIGEHTKRIGQGNYAPYSPKDPYARELSELSQNVNRLSQTLEEQKTVRERVVRDYAHELRTPLSVLQANLEAFEDGIWEPTPSRLASSYEEIQRLNRMLVRLEELAKLYEPGLKLNMNQVDLKDLVLECIEQFTPVCQEKQIALSSRWMPVSVRGDRDQLKQVLVNLLANGIQYTPAGGSIIISLRDHGDGAMICVEDTGIGIEEKDLPHIFDYLYRVDPSRSRHTGGSGIGLSIVQKILKEHGGSVSVESQPGKGSTFAVMLPGNGLF